MSSNATLRFVRPLHPFMLQHLSVWECLLQDCRLLTHMLAIYELTDKTSPLRSSR